MRRRAVLLAAFSLAATGAATPPSRTLYAIVYRPGPAWRQGRPMREQDLAAHGRYMKQLFDQGVLFAGGPLGAEDGLALVWAENDAAAADIVAKDPSVIAGVFVAKIEPWRPRFRRDEALPK